MPDPVPTFTYLVSKYAELHPRLAYLHVVEPGVQGAGNGPTVTQIQACTVLFRLLSTDLLPIVKRLYTGHLGTASIDLSWSIYARKSNGGG